MQIAFDLRAKKKKMLSVIKIKITVCASSVGNKKKSLLKTRVDADWF